MAHTNEQLEAVKRELELGLDSPEVISIRTGIPVDVVEEIVRSHQQIVKSSRSNVDIMRDNLRLLQDLLETAEWEYRAQPNVDSASALVQMITTSLSTIKEIESRKDPAVILNEILGRLIQPLFRDIIKYATAEAAKARDELNERVPHEHHARVDAALKNLVRGIGRASSADYAKCVEVLASVLECKSEDAKVRPLIRPVEDSDEQQRKEGTGDR